MHGLPPSLSIITRIFHLQFAKFVEDTLIMEEKSWGKGNIQALKSIFFFILFELILSLKVNFNKSLLVGVNVFDIRYLDI